jgi:hypothetical protein
VRGARRLVVLGLAIGTLVGFCQLPSGAAEHSPEKTRDVVYFRSVLCYVPKYLPSERTTVKLTPSSCSPSTQLDSGNLGISPNDSEQGFAVQNVSADAALAGVPSTSPAKETASATVLLPGISTSSGTGAMRYLLGPAEMTSAAIARASVAHEAGMWVVNYTMTKRGAALWDKVSEENFHKVLGIDFDGSVVSAPIIQPSQYSFSSFDGEGELSGGFTRAEALKIARALQSGQ